MNILMVLLIILIGITVIIIGVVIGYLFAKSKFQVEKGVSEKELNEKYVSRESFDKLNDELSSTKTNYAVLKNENDNLKEQKTKLEIEISVLKEKFNTLSQENSLLKQENTVYKQTENDRRNEFDKKMATLNEIQKKIVSDRENEIAKHQQEELDKLTQMKETWLKHEENVKNIIKLICEKNTIEYIDKEKVPFKGKPDNTIKICNEYIIFDAKSPASDDLDSFPNYIKLQTEAVKKYVKEENVKKDIYLVIPSNTVDVIKQFSYNMSDYNVYVVTTDSLEPIILTLKKIEQYEFAEQLSPEERENICRIIGKFAHISKRRIQIDHYFAKQFVELLYKCESDLPTDVFNQAVEFEKSEKLNPPTDKRVKQINLKELESETQKLGNDADNKGIVTQENIISEEINKVPLYKKEKKESST